MHMSLRHAVDFGRAGAALARLAVPAHGEVARLLGLNLMHGIEHHHAFGDRRGVVLEAAGLPGRRARSEKSPSNSLLHLLDNLLHFVRHGRQRFARELHRTIRRAV